MKAKLGCLVGLLLVGALSVELWVVLVLLGNRWVLDHVTPLGVFALIIIAAIVGVKLAKRHGSRIMAGLFTGGAGPSLVGAFGGILLAFPGFVSDVFGILLLVPLMQRLLGRWATLVGMSIARNAMKNALGGGGFPGMPPGGFPGMPPGGMPGGFPGFPGGPFPGMKPDDRIGRGPKTIDTTVEKD